MVFPHSLHTVSKSSTRAVNTEALDYLNNIAEDLVKTKLAREDYFVDTNFCKSEVELVALCTENQNCV